MGIGALTAEPLLVKLTTSSRLLRAEGMRMETESRSAPSVITAKGPSSTSISSPEVSSSPVQGTLANDLLLFRKRRGWNQRQAASELGIPRVWLSLWESGKALPDWTQASLLAEKYGTTVSRLFGSHAAEFLARR